MKIRRTAVLSSETLPSSDNVSAYIGKFYLQSGNDDANDDYDDDTDDDNDKLRRTVVMN